MKVLHVAKNFRLVSEELTYNDDGEIRTIEFIEQPPVVVAVVVVGHDIVLVEHLRPILHARLLECPGGKADASGESLDEAMYRELSEEVGLKPARLEELGSFYSSVGTSTERIHVFRAESLQTGERNPSDVKRMRLVTMPIHEAQRRLSEKPFSDGKTQIALSLAFGMQPRPSGEVEQT